MTAPSRPSPSRHVRRLGIAVMCIGTLALTGTSTMAFASGHRPSNSTTTAASVVGLRQGNSGPAVQAVQQKLIGLGYYVAGGADGNFGPGTTAALRVFQKQNGLNPTGVVTENTARYLGLSGGAPTGGTPARPQGAQAAPAAAPAPAASGSTVGLRQGATGEPVRQLQVAILATGLYLRGGADGAFGASTHRAVTLVQRVNGLPETGVVDAATASVLGVTGSASSPSTPSPAGTVAAATPSSSSYVGLGVGSNGPTVVKLQQAIMATGLVVRGGADGVFGRQTRNALVIYQRVNGLPQTGIVDEPTARLLGLLTPAAASSPAGVVSAPSGGGSTSSGFATYDERGARVVALQQALLGAGISFTGGADGIFGSATAGAVMKFQQARSLRVTGKVDAATATALGLQGQATPAPAPIVNVTLQARPLANGPCWYGDTWQATRGSGRVHLGVDVGAPAGTPLQAVASGRVTQIYRDRPGSLSGNGLKIGTADGTYFFYAHLASFAPGIDVGVPVTAGQQIGTMGKTGNAAITHLHFEVHPGGGAAINPFPYLRAVGAC